MDSSFHPKSSNRSRGGDSPPRAGLPQATSVIIVALLVLLVVGGLAHVFTELFHG